MIECLRLAPVDTDGSQGVFRISSSLHDHSPLNVADVDERHSHRLRVHCLDERCAIWWQSCALRSLSIVDTTTRLLLSLLLYAISNHISYR